MNLSKKEAGKLVTGCIKNKRTAQEALYKLFYADMLRVCSNYLPDKQLAKEALNTGFLKVFQSVKSFNAEKGELGGWIRKLMVYSAIDLCRKELKFTNQPITGQEAEEVFISPEVLEKLYFEDILKSIRTLPFATQTVFNLSVLDGFTHKEISEQLHISEGTSRWHLAEAKKKLRALLETSERTDAPKERSGEAK